MLAKLQGRHLAKWEARRSALLLAASAGLALVACGVVDPPPSTPTPTPTPTPAIAWLEHTELGRGDGIIEEKVAYLSGGLKIYAEVYRPDVTTHRTLLLWNHGGFAGLVDGEREVCRKLARLGFVVAASYYRGEGGSQGTVEACKGEVDDVTAMLGILKTQSYVDATHIASLGASHGGCVALSVAIQQADIRAVVDLAGPSDWAALYNWMADQVARGEPFCKQIGRTDCLALHRDMLKKLEAGFGGTPAQVPQAYADRSPGQRLSGLRVPALWIHGQNDVIVNVDQACRKRTAMSDLGRAPASWYIDTSLHERSSDTLCGGGFRTDPVLFFAAFETNELVIYQGQGHELKDAKWRDHVVELVAAFLIGHL